MIRINKKFPQKKDLDDIWSVKNKIEKLQKKLKLLVPNCIFCSEDTIKGYCYRCGQYDYKYDKNGNVVGLKKYKKS